MTLDEALRSHDMNELIDSMTAYAYSRMKTIELKHLEGKTPDDFVGEVLMKVVEGERDWTKANCSFKEFLFGCLRSHISNFLKNFEPKFGSVIPESRVSTFASSSELKNMAVELLISQDAKSDELEVFDCWVDGISRPSDIAKHLSKNVKEVHNTIKRLLRKMPVLKSKMKHLV